MYRRLKIARLTLEGQLAAGIAHNFNNVLTAISANAELLGMQPSSSLERNAVANILAAVEHGSSIVHKLYELAGRQEKPFLEKLCVAGVFCSVQQVVDAQIRQTGVAVEVDVPDGLHVLADAGQLRQVLMNLVLNGLQAMPAAGKLTFSARLEASDIVELRVSDTGCGISPENLAHIFTPFFTTKGAMNGTGLGLSTSLAMVKNMGGTITVESAPGRGTTVCVCLPCYR